MPPVDRPLPRFVAEPPHALEPYGRWRTTLEQRFVEACRDAAEHGAPGQLGSLTWFPERTLAGRTYVPATADTGGAEEFFGFVSFVRTDSSGEPEQFEVVADYTDETARTNPQWRMDLNDEVIGGWRGPGEAEGGLTLVWGTALVPGGAVATAELGAETVDQCALVQSDRFTLVALDAVTGMGDELYLEVKLWNKNGELLAVESLYEDSDESGENSEGRGEVGG